MADRSKVVAADDYRWADIPVHEYKTEGTHFRDITRQTLIGEAEDEQALNSITRYFEVQPGGYSTLEEHAHPHSVVILRGSGEAILQDRVQPIGLHDRVYVAPHTFHQFHASGTEPLGFLCIVDRERDRPRRPDDAEVEALKQSGPVADLLRT